eukprot:TRINITY_DN30486_c0_g1_i1.p1 TRINITY_DN30486_c0_g1~~TRINITY_DN30486_c0_g1_i1.p1  ORF type:complete len:219 (+),score=25.31 TRINITY_DN30486_c0_g1_i1:52-708(+)
MEQTVFVFVGGTLTSQLLMVASDISCQGLEYKLELETIKEQRLGTRPTEFAVDWERHLIFNCVTMGSGFMFQFWWYFMDSAVPGTSWTPVLLKTLYTQAFDTVVIPIEQSAIAYLTPGVTIYEKLSQELVPMQLFAIALLPAMHIIQFMYIPLRYQIIFSRINGFVMGLALSYLSFRRLHGKLESDYDDESEDDCDYTSSQKPPSKPKHHRNCTCVVM